MALWKVGAVAKKAGITVRTLHHYDELGLLKPSQRAPNGYRLYDDADTERLARILLLRQLGLGLDEVAAALDDPHNSLPTLLRLQLDRAREALDEQARLVERLVALDQHLSRTGAVTPDQLAHVLEVIQMFEKYYTKDQLEELRQRREALGEDAMRQAERDWAEVFAGFREAMERGDDPASEAVQALVARSNALIDAFTGGNPGIRRSLGNMYRNEGPEKTVGPHGFDTDPVLWEYMGAARAASQPDQA